MTGAVIAQRLTAQVLAGPPATDVVSVTRHLLAVQAQDERGVRLAVRARTAGLTAADVDRALTEERSVVISWSCRGTLHLVAAEDYHWLHELTTPPLAAAAMRRVSRTGLSEEQVERAISRIERALGEDGPMTRAQLVELLGRHGFALGGDTLVALMFAASMRGLVVRGPMIGGRHAYALADAWLGKRPSPPDRSRALAELARRYLVAHGPAADYDLARWAGLPLRDARKGLAAIGRRLVEHGDGLVTLAGTPPAAELPPPRLLGSWDALQVGWKDRRFVNGEFESSLIHGGWFRPFALVGGQAVSAWTIRDRHVELGVPFVPVSAEDQAALVAEAADVRRFLALT